MLAALQVHKVEISQKKCRSNVKNSPKFDLRAHLIGMCGVDLTPIDGIKVTTAMKVMSEVGTDMSRFKSVKQFAMRLGSCVRDKDIGRKSAIGGKQAYSEPCCPGAAHGGSFIEIQSVCTVGAYYRRLCGRLDKAKVNHSGSAQSGTLDLHNANERDRVRR